jgi:hypothetical protein
VVPQIVVVVSAGNVGSASAIAPTAGANRTRVGIGPPQAAAWRREERPVGGGRVPLAGERPALE